MTQPGTTQFGPAMRVAMAITLAAAAACGGTVAGGASSANAGPLTISRWTVDAGGTSFSRVGTWTLAGTAGQPDAGRASTSPYTVASGFWGGAPLSVTAVPIPDPMNPSDPADPAAETMPRVARILPAAPNPTPNATRFAFELPESRPVRIRIFNVAGSLVRTVTDRVWPAGRHRAAWDGRDGAGNTSAAGIYFVRVRLGDLERTQKLLIVR